jgi:hypothetical protein
MSKKTNLFDVPAEENLEAMAMHEAQMGDFLEDDHEDMRDLTETPEEISAFFFATTPGIK